MVYKQQIKTVSDGMLVRAPAKINLSLLIAGRRDDGFHEIETLMAKVNLYDEILIQQGTKKGIEVVSEGAYWAPQGSENLVYKACETLMENTGTSPNIKITLTKNIPAGSGLGSASSDAAATLIGVNKYLRLNIPTGLPDSSENKYEGINLQQMAARLGSDIAFFLDGPLAFCTGKGEKIKKIHKNFPFLALLILPDVSVSTKKVYANYKHDPKLYSSLKSKINGYIQKNRFDSLSKMCANMLQICCFNLHKEFAVLKAEIESIGIGPVCLSGSGSSMFIILGGTEEDKARQYKQKVEQKIGCNTVIVSNNRW